MTNIYPYELLKLILVPHGTPEYSQSQTTPNDPGAVIIIAHGDFKGNIFGPDGNILSPQNIADMIKQAGGKDGQPIQFRACGAGSGTNSTAQNISNFFPNSTVSGPVSSVTPDGTTWWPSQPWGFFPYGNSGMVPFHGGRRQ